MERTSGQMGLTAHNIMRILVMNGRQMVVIIVEKSYVQKSDLFGSSYILVGEANASGRMPLVPEILNVGLSVEFE
ncbi:unnamed protein product, partial [Rotaria magnacalcarata]